MHISAGARIGRRCSLGQNVYVGNDVRHRQQRQDPEQRLGLRRGDAGGRRLLRPEHGVHQRLQPALAVARKDEYRRTLVRRGATLGANCTDRLRHHDRRATPSSAPARVVNRDVPDFALMVGVPARQIGWMSRHGERLALPLSATARPPARTPASVSDRLAIVAQAACRPGKELNERPNRHSPSST